TRVSVMLVLPDPEVFHPEVSVSKPGLPTKFGGGGTVVLVLVEVVVEGWVVDVEEIVLVEVVVDDWVVDVEVELLVDVVLVCVVLVLVDVVEEDEGSVVVVVDVDVVEDESTVVVV